ncbi:MAG: serine/threonine-protein phosphatase [Lachnospiraceae bacterium]|nr:serine/threonine-protein phosphatase [Lachnospiraceae bacterium]
MNKKGIKSITGQVIGPFALFLVILMVGEMIFIVRFQGNHYLGLRAKSAAYLASYTAEIFEEYDAIEWFADFWSDHYDEMRFVYDPKGIEKLEQEWDEKNGLINIWDFTEDEIEDFSDEDQLLLAEIAYAYCSEELDLMMSNFDLENCYAFKLEDDDVFYLASGGTSEKKRHSQGGDVYELGDESPYDEKKDPVLLYLADTESSSEEELALNRMGYTLKDMIKGNDVVMYAPVIDRYGEMVMLTAASLDWGRAFTYTKRVALLINILTAVLVVLIMGWISFLLRKYVILPIDREQEVIQEYGRGKDPEKALRGLAAIQTENEIKSLAESFSAMIWEINHYTEEIRSVTAEKERIEAELSIAARIQKDILPSDFPAGKEFALYALSDPAKEVGGDFYDFYYLDKTHLAMLVGDVSGKGMSAALFMIAAKTLIRTRAKLGGTPAEILKDANEQLLENNPSFMFVTVWFTVIDLSTGKGLLVNAGHTDTVFKRADGPYEILKNPHSLVLAALEDTRFEEYSFKLRPGDRVFIYSDGVTDAQNIHDEYYGTERMLAALNKNREAPVQELLTAVRRDVEEFSQGTSQYDDITMLGFTYFG